MAYDEGARRWKLVTRYFKLTHALFLSRKPPVLENDIRVAVLGNVDAGKSSLIGVLKAGELDDGRGSSRKLVMKFQHELETGRTTSPAAHLAGFDENGNYSIVKDAHRVVTLLDMAGHEKYFKSVVGGVASGMVDYALVLVNARQDPTHMTVNHINLASSLGIPIVVVFTKIDGCPSDVLKNTKKLVTQLVKSVGKAPFAVRTEKDIDTVAYKLDSLAPLVSVSSVTGEWLPLLGKLLVSLPKRRHHSKKVNRPFEFLIDDVLNVTGIGSVVIGFVNAGQWKKGENVHVGPLSDGSYIKSVVKSVQIERSEVTHVWAGQTAAFALSLTKANRKRLRKGMVLLKEPVPATRSITADICFLRGREGTTVIKGRYETMVHILHVKQIARVIDFSSLDNEKLPSGEDSVLRPGDRATVRLQFLQRPEYIRPGMRILLRDGHVRGVGIVKEVFS